MNFKKDKKKIYGDIGEKIVTNFFSSHGFIVKVAINPFDMGKDIGILSLKNGNSRITEVKTQAPYYQRNALTFPKSQEDKCRSVDFLTYIVVASKEEYFKYENMIVIVDTKTMELFEYTTRKGVKMCGIDINQPAVHPMEKISQYEIDELRKYKTSRYGEKN